MQKQRIVDIIDSETARWKEQQENASINNYHNYDGLKSTLMQFEVDLTRYLKMSLLEEHVADIKDDNARKKYMREKARSLVESQFTSRLYAPYYLPEEAAALGQ